VVCKNLGTILDDVYSHDFKFIFPKEEPVKKIHCHKIILSLRSPFFLNYFKEDGGDIQIVDYKYSG
jgi:hypothetical protein